MLTDKYRNKIEILCEILKTIKDKKIPKTRLAYQVYLSPTLFKRYAQFLEKTDMIDYNKENDNYRITMRGNTFITLVEKIKELCNYKEIF